MLYRCEKCGGEKRQNAFPIVAGEEPRRFLCRLCRAFERGAPREKRCSRCKKVQPINNFPARRERANGSSRCYDCQRELAANRYWDSGEATKRSMREWHLVKRYGLTLAGYDALLESQGGVCGARGGPPVKSGGNHFHVDHDHDTGAVRGLLCGHCNHVLGMVYDDVDRLRRLIAYLERHVTCTQ